MKKSICLLSTILLCATMSAQLYIYKTQGIAAELEEIPDSIITLPLYHTPVPAQNEGALSGVFSVSPNRKVRFSQGNLQYVIADKKWQFAEHQYDTVGGDIKKPVIDQFGFGTSGWNQSGAKAFLPTDTTSKEEDYYAFIGDIHLSTLSGYMEKRDWGIYNPIANGGNKAGLWRTLTLKEWATVANYRWTPYAFAIVNHVYGIVLLPDNWNNNSNPNDTKIHPALQFDREWRSKSTLTEEQIADILETYNNDTLRAHAELMIETISRPLFEEQYDETTHERYYLTEDELNVTPAEWAQFENLGCVFLPFNKDRSNPQNSVSNYSWEYYCTYYSTEEISGLIMNRSHSNGSQPDKFMVRTSSSLPSVGGCVRLIQVYQ